MKNRKRSEKQLLTNQPIIENELSSEEVETIHKFGECWIKDYSRSCRNKWMKALWLFAWDRKVIFNN